MTTSSSAQICLGDEIECKVTGFKGVAISRTQHLNGCVQFGVQAAITKDGKFGESWSIDESQLKLIKSKKVKVEPKPAGGPSRRLS